MIIDLILIVVIFHIIACFFCAKAVVKETNHPQRYITTVMVIPSRNNNNNNNAEDQNKPEDDLPPYTPPTPKTQAAMTASMTDLPPTYEETIDLSDVRIPIPNGSSDLVNNNDHHASIQTDIITNLSDITVVNASPTSTNTNPDINVTPEIVVIPLNTHTSTTP